jgi:ABC-type iron transport system FetAB ATPase subunit
MDSTNLDSAREARINELCHRMTTCEERAARLWICDQLKREIKALNDGRLARLNEALVAVGA